MNISATELPNFVRKYYLLHELLIFRYWRQNISVSNIALGPTYCSQALSCQLNVFRERVRHSPYQWWYQLLWALWDVQICSSLIQDKSQWPVLSRCFASSTATASHSWSVWRLLYFSTGQRCCPHSTWDSACASVNSWNTRLHHSSSVAS